MSAQEYARYPEFLAMREVEVNGRILVTTLLDPTFVSARALGTLYKMRWNIEVDFRTIKATLQMDVLRCKSQPMVEKEIAVCFLAYNLVRWAMAKAAALADVLPRAAPLYRGQASAEHIRRSASPNAGQSNSLHDRNRAGEHRHTETAASTRPDRASRKETTTQKSSAVNRAAPNRARSHSCSATA